MSILSCPTCEEKFESATASRKYCSVRCRDRAHHLRKKAAGTPQARYLRKKADGTGYVPRGKSPGDGGRHEKSCTECGAFFVAHANTKYCTPICKSRYAERIRAASGYYRREHVKRRQNEYSRAKYRKDLESGTAKGDGSRIAVWQERGASGMWDLDMFNAVCCVEDCSRPLFARLKCKPHYEREMRLSGAEWAHYNEISGNDYRRRAEKFGVQFEQFNKWDIYDRDNWTCGICLDPVDPELTYPDPMSVSLDHVIPLSKGGGHIPSNTQCSHLSCNVRKGARHGEGIGAGARVS